MTKLGQASSAQTFAGPIQSITAHKAASGVLFIVGLVGALYSASSDVGAFMRACNVIYETPEGRPFWKLRPLQVLVTLLMLLLLVVIALALVLTGPIVSAVAGPIGVGSTAVSVWNIAKWPVLVLVLVLLLLVMFTVLFYASPNVANFGSYDKTYGALAGVVAFLVWLWITNSALLLGAELNAERERTHELKAGIPGAEREIQLDARSEPKTPKTT